MRYLVRKSIIDVLGYIWMPHALCAQRIELSDYDVDNLAGEERPTREHVEQWLATHASEFSEIVDFRASLEIGNETVNLDFSEPENEWRWQDSMFGEGDE